VKPFVDGKFFDGELYIDDEQKCYTALQYYKMSLMEVLKLAFSKKWRDAASKAKTMALGGDLKGDGYQNGGALVVDKNGKQLYEYIQKDASEHISAEEIFTALNIKT
jgi:prostamide/prostaglandin F2alpha synthase